MTDTVPWDCEAGGFTDKQNSTATTYQNPICIPHQTYFFYQCLLKVQWAREVDISP